jgi:hypothetical protein
MREIAVVAAPAVNYTDEGGAVTNPTDFHLSPGDLGKWHQILTLRTARTECSAAPAASPGIANRFYLGIFFGSTGAANLATYEFLAIDQNGNDQSVVFQSPATSIPVLPDSSGDSAVARRNIDTAILRPGDSSVLTGTSTWFLVMSGFDTAGTNSATDQQHFFNVTDGTGNGEFIPHVPLSGNSPNYPSYGKAGYCAFAGNGLAYDLGGTVTVDNGANEYNIVDPLPQVPNNAFTPSPGLDASVGTGGAGLRYHRCIPDSSWVVGAGGENTDGTLRDNVFIAVL